MLKIDFGLMVDNKLDMSTLNQQCTLRAQKDTHILVCIKRSVASMSIELILPLLCDGEN